ncbi:MAG: hypothetical protein Q9170_007092 [Blastenia crenularia]
MQRKNTIILMISTLLAVLFPAAPVSAQIHIRDRARGAPSSLSEDESLQLENRQLVAGLILTGTAGAGMLAGRYRQWRKDLAASRPGINNAQGSACHRSGSWFSTKEIASVMEHGCYVLAMQALSWQKTGNKHLMNPEYLIVSHPDGSEFFDEQGNKITLTVTLWDENGDRAGPWINREACLAAMETILYDCRGSNPDTRGGSFFYGHDGVAGYSVDPNCFPTPGKACPKNWE